MVVITGDSILSAIDMQGRHKYSFWDSMIIQAAINGMAHVLYSEDLSDGQTVGGVKIENPFKL